MASTLGTTKLISNVKLHGTVTFRTSAYKQHKKAHRLEKVCSNHSPPNSSLDLPLGLFSMNSTTQFTNRDAPGTYRTLLLRYCYQTWNQLT